MAKKIKLNRKQMEAWLTKYWGKRCKKFLAGCGACEAWAAYDKLFDFDKVGELLWEKHLRLIRFA